MLKLTKIYFERLFKLRTLAFSKRFAKFSGNGQRKSDQLSFTFFIVAPSKNGVIPSIIVSTSGSSGIDCSEYHFSFKFIFLFCRIGCIVTQCCITISE